jgi:uncharacterized protein YjbI with pentapeptide repeats
VFDELDLGGATLTRVAFEGCRTDRLLLGGSRAEHLDLRGLELDGIEGLDGLRGAVLTGQQVASMAHLLAESLGAQIEG